MNVLEMESAQTLEQLPATDAGLIVKPSDINFHDVGGGIVEINITVTNESEYHSSPTVMRLESAPLGAFVSWQPLTQLPLPPLAPGESRIFTTRATRPLVAPLGNFDRVPPTRLLAALAAPHQPSPDPRSWVATVRQLFLQRDADNLAALRGEQPATVTEALRNRNAQRPASNQTVLARDLMDMMGRGQTHWAGNINVFIGHRAVERHVAKALRIYPGRNNMAMFVVGNPSAHDAFAFQLVGLEADWKARLFSSPSSTSIALDQKTPWLQQNQWVQTSGRMLVLLAVEPPVHCEQGKLEVQVRRRSTGETAVVEFDLDPTAQGSGCYYV